MGEYAEMMLDGTCCQGCGEFLHEGEDGPGFPGYCPSCQKLMNVLLPPEITKPHQCPNKACRRRFKTEQGLADHAKAMEGKNGHAKA